MADAEGDRRTGAPRKRSRSPERDTSGERAPSGERRNPGSRERSRRRRPSRSRSRGRGRRRRSRSPSSSSSASSGRSGSDSVSSSSRSRSGSRKRRAKRERKHRKADKHKKGAHEKKKDKKKRKDKKKKKAKKSKRDDGMPSGVVDQNQFGKYGILRESDMFRKQPEFDAWMREVKGLSADASLPKGEIMEHFRTFMEDYNTVTLPHEKYYDIARWEVKEQQRLQRKEEKRAKKHGLQTEAPEELRKRAEKERLEQAYAQLTAMTPEKAAAMREQDKLRRQMQIAFKSGDSRTAQRIQRRLEPET